MRGTPAKSIRQKPAGIKPAAKVVPIPVHFVRSDPERSVSVSTTQKPEAPDRAASALRIQKVFRGFLVRKSVRRIMSIRKEVEDIEQRLLCSEMQELIRRDERERLRVNETLMSLLFKLDSIRGIDSGVRDRRGERIDSDELSESVNQTGDMPDSLGNEDEYGKSTNQSELCDQLEQSVDVQNQATSNYTTNDEKTPVEGEELQEVKEESDCPIRECMEGSVERGVDDENETRSRGLDGEEESRRNTELLETMVEKNEKMMRMMSELCQRNEIQTRMLNSLAQRVDQLEKVMCDKLKTKKKKRRHPA
ncbi:hypothetical protein HAX54_031428 [Datura stramonium]|uniref:BAG domain-containing protein n=1 Tax=Datura stramonium TaxID=4076 RepID=A0ABS8VA17_DATST|nr:hypothetical protein [Datura stramonium]